MAQQHVLTRAILHSCGPVWQCHFRAGQSTFQHKARRVRSVYPVASLHRCSDIPPPHSPVCDLKETSAHKPHCMSPLRSSGASLSTSKLIFPAAVSCIIQTILKMSEKERTWLFPCYPRPLPVASDHIVVSSYCTTALQPRRAHVFFSLTQCSN